MTRGGVVQSRARRTWGSLWLIGLGLVWPGMESAIAADRYTVDPVHTSISFTVPHLVINRVHGQFGEFSGTILYDEQDPSKSSVEVIIQAASITTANADRDKHLRSPDFFDVATYPTITFHSTQVEPRGEGYVCRGTLTMRGVSKEIEIPFAILGKIQDPWGKTRIGIEGGLTINRRDYGISWSKVMDGGGLVVGDDVKILLNVEAIQQPATTP